MAYNDDERGFTMDKKDEKQEKKCFIITPIGNENSDVFRKAKGVIESTIKPILREYGFTDIKPAYEINVSGMISSQIINRIIDDDLVVVNLTGNNPNVMYELCLRHVAAKPIIHICEVGTTLPFDIKDSRTIFYVNDMLGVEELKYNLRGFLDQIDYSKDCYDNPIYNSYKYGKLLKETEGTKENEILKILLQIQNSLAQQQYENLHSDLVQVKVDKIWGAGYNEHVNEDYHDIDNKIIEEWLPYTGCSLRAHEVARALKVKPSYIVNVATKVGFNVESTTAVLSADMINKILTYIRDNVGDDNAFSEKE